MTNLATGTFMLVTGIGAAVYFGGFMENEDEKVAGSTTRNTSKNRRDVQAKRSWFVTGVKENNAEVDGLVTDLLRRGKFAGRRKAKIPIDKETYKQNKKSYKDYDEDYEDMIGVDE